MGLMVDEQTTRKLRDGRKVTFNLFAYSDDFYEENEEGCYSCNIVIQGEPVENYVRLFLVRKFSENHYFNFIKKFCNDSSYREQYNVKHAIVARNDTDEIDARIKDAVALLSSRGLITKFSCQGTDDKWSDRPCVSDGHSVDAYIVFVDRLPDFYIALFSKDNRLYVEGDSIRVRKRKDNHQFSQILLNLLNSEQNPDLKGGK